MIETAESLAAAAAYKAFLDWKRPFLVFDRGEYAQAKSAGLTEWCASTSRIIEGNFKPSNAQEILQPKQYGYRRLAVLTLEDQAYFNYCVLKAVEPIFSSINNGASSNYAFDFIGDPYSKMWCRDQFDNVDKWFAFERASSRLASHTEHLLCVDIASFYESISIPALFRLLGQLGAHDRDLDRLSHAFDIWGVSTNGLPPNYMASHFLAEIILGYIDSVSGCQSDDVLRFLDDYRIFGESDAHAKEIEMRISENLSLFSLKLNEKKRRQLVTGDRIPDPSHIRRSQANSKIVDLSHTLDRLDRFDLRKFDQEELVDILYKLTIANDPTASSMAVICLISHPESFREVCRYLSKIELDHGWLKAKIIDICDQTDSPFISYCALRIAECHSIELDSNFHRRQIWRTPEDFLLKEAMAATLWNTSDHLELWREYTVSWPRLERTADLLARYERDILDDGPNGIWAF